MLRSRVRLLAGAWMFVCCVCFVLSGRGLCDELITRPEESYWLWCVVVCDLETLKMWRPWSALGRSATGEKNVRDISLYSSIKDCQNNVVQGNHMKRNTGTVAFQHIMTWRWIECHDSSEVLAVSIFKVEAGCSETCHFYHSFLRLSYDSSITSSNQVLHRVWSGAFCFNFHYLSSA
jgi:hypothetical protein